MRPTSGTAAALLLAGSILSPANAQTLTNPCVYIASLARKGYTDVYATHALQCLQSQPFNATAASSFIKFYNATIVQSQSTTAYLKDPPSSYQMSPIDLNKELGDIQKKVDAGSYTSEYDFELDIFHLWRRSHDGHFSVFTGGLGVFAFKSPLNFTSVSRDGQALPEIWSYEEAVLTYDHKLNYRLSPVKTINGIDAAKFMDQYAANFTTGYMDHDANYNSLMMDPASMLAQPENSWNRSPVFTWDWLNVTFANGSSQNLPWEAHIWSSQVEKLSQVTGGFSFYEEFAFLQDSDDTDEPSKRSNPMRRTIGPPNDSESSEGWANEAWPEPFIAQPNLGTDEGSGWVTGYAIEEASLAVMSIPSFDMSKNVTKTFSDTIDLFISQAQKSGLKRVLFDVRGNPGGTTVLAYEIYKHFFPNATVHTTTRMRVGPVANIIGETFSGFVAEGMARNHTSDPNDVLPKEYEGSISVAQLYADAVTDKAFTSWQDMAPPVVDKGDTFTKPYSLNLSNPLWDLDMTENGIEIEGFADRAADSQKPQPFAAQDMAILTDGQCSSTCAVFLEQFHHYGRVKVVALGGRSQNGPMQTTGGVRGMQIIPVDYIVDSINKTAILNETQADNLPNIIDKGLVIASANYNNRDQLRLDDQGKASIPTQFAYEAADCRIFLTPDTFNNYTNLWKYAADAIWGDGSKCVQGSTGHPSTGNITDTTGLGAARGNPSGGGANQRVVQGAASTASVSTVLFVGLLSMVTMMTC